MTDTTPADRRYALGHDARELERLARQGAFYAPLTEPFLVEAGLRHGMRVLDFGCGVGDVTLIAARLVGDAGSVLGVDLSADAIAAARRRLHALGVRNARAEQAASTADISGEFDAVIGRCILMHLPAPVNTLRELIARLRPGGLVAFQEMDFTHPPLSHPPVPLVDRYIAWVTAALRAAGMNMQMELDLHHMLAAAGVHSPAMRLAARIESAENEMACLHLAEAVRTLMPIIERLGLATTADVPLDTLADDLCEALGDADAVVRPPMLVGGFGTVG